MRAQMTQGKNFFHIILAWRSVKIATYHHGELPHTVRLGSKSPTLTDHHADGQHLCFTMFPSSEHPSVGNDNTAGCSGFFINTVSSLPLPADIKVVAVPPSITVEMLMGISVRVRRPSFACTDFFISSSRRARFLLNSVFCHHNPLPSRCGVRPHGHRGDTGGIF